MTDLGQDFNYLSNGYEFNERKPKRSIKRKLFIVISFVAILAIIPSLILAISELDFGSNERIAVNNTTPTPEVIEVKIEKPNEAAAKSADAVQNADSVAAQDNIPAELSNEALVINNDSYWKISKRVCGEGKYFLSVQDQNDSKALFEGELVTVNCTL